MSLSNEEIVALKNSIMERANNFPDLDQLIADGKIKYKSGWYQIIRPEAFEPLKHYATSFRCAKDGGFHIKIKKPTKLLKDLASKL